MKDLQARAADLFTRLRPNDRRLINAYLALITGMAGKDLAEIHRFMLAVIGGEYAEHALEIVAAALDGEAEAWGIIRATIHAKKRRAGA